MITLTLLMLLLASGFIYLGASLFFIVLLTVFKVFWFGLRLLFSLGAGVVIGAAALLFILIKLSGLIFMMAALGVLCVMIWALIRLFTGGRGRVTAYAYAPREPWRGASSREASLYRLRATLDRFERRMDDLDAEMARRR